jgi:hypothetical protein
MTESYLARQLGLKYPIFHKATRWTPRVFGLNQPGFKFEFFKSEIRNKFKTPENPNLKTAIVIAWRLEIRRRFLSFGFGISFGFRVSDF